MKINSPVTDVQTLHKGPAIVSRPLSFDSLAFFNDKREIVSLKQFSNSRTTLPGLYYVKRDLGNKWVIRKDKPKYKEFVLVEFELVEDTINNTDGHLPHSPLSYLSVMYTKIIKVNPDYFKGLDLENVSVANSKKLAHTSAVIKD